MRRLMHLRAYSHTNLQTQQLRDQPLRLDITCQVSLYTRCARGDKGGTLVPGGMKSSPSRDASLQLCVKSERGHTYGKVDVHKDKLLVRIQKAIDELGDAEQLHLRPTAQRDITTAAGISPTVATQRHAASCQDRS